MDANLHVYDGFRVSSCGMPSGRNSQMLVATFEAKRVGEWVAGLGWAGLGWAGLGETARY